MKGFEYIWRYLQGERKGKAANRLEREALADPFLYEALEGFEGVAADHEQAVRKLERRLQPETGEKVRWHVFRWVAAASVLLVGGVALWLLAGQERQEFEQVAAVRQEVKADSAVPEVAVVAAAVVPDSDTIVKQEKAMAKSLEASPGRRREKRAVAVAVRGEKVEAEAMADQVVAEVADAVQAVKDSGEVKNVEELMGKRLERVDFQRFGGERGIRIRGISPAKQQPPRKKKVEEQQEEKFIPYDMGKKRNRKVKPGVADWDRKAEGNQIWLRRFEQYAADSLRYPEMARVNGIEGEVKLSVRLNKKGHPSRIRILQELSPECDREAVRLVEFYPGVLGSGNAGKIELTVSFRLPREP